METCKMRQADAQVLKKCETEEPEPMMTDRGRFADNKDTLVDAQEIELQEEKASIAKTQAPQQTKQGVDDDQQK